MGVVKNLMVRIGADVRGVVNGMKSARSATSQATDGIKKSTKETKRSIIDGFTAPAKAVKEYSAEVSRTKAAHQAAVQNTTVLTDEIAKLEDVYDTVKNATDGLDLSKPLKEQISETESTIQSFSQKMDGMKEAIGKTKNSYDSLREIAEGLNLGKSLESQLAEAEKEFEALGKKMEETRNQIKFWNTIEPAGAQFHADQLRIELERMIPESDKALARIISLEDACNKLGKVDSTVPLKKLLHGMQKELEDSENKLRKLETESDVAVNHLNSLKNAADQVGANGMGYASAAGLKKLQEEIQTAKTRLEVTKAVAAETEGKLKSLRLGPTLLTMLKNIGTTAAQVAGTGVKMLGTGLKNLAVGAVHGIASIPGKLRNIGNSATASCGGLGKMVRSIRNIGIASLGMRVATGMFGRLRSIISSYIYQNEALNKSVTSLRNQMGEALLPAINLVMVAMQRLMPIVQAVSNVINSIFTALFGKMEATGAAIASTAEEAASAAEGLNTYGFDQITKESDSSSGSGSGGSGGSSSGQEGQQSALVQKLTAWIEALKAAFVAGDWENLGRIVGDGINAAVDAINSVDIGGKIGSFVANFVTTLHAALTTTDLSAIGTTAGEIISAAVGQVDWQKAGQVLAMGWLAAKDFLVGAILGTDWALIGKSLTDCVSGFLQSVTEWIRTVDWLQLGECAATLIANVDWTQLCKDLFNFFGTALVAGVNLLWGFADDAFSSIGEYFTGKIEECGGNVAAGLLKGILDGLGSIVDWVSTNIVKPFVDGFCSIEEGAVEAFRGLWNGIKGWINQIIGGIESMANWVIRGINGLIDSFNGLAEVGTYFGLNLQIPRMDSVYLPRLAKGAVVDKPTAAIIGEAGKEAVMPLENNTGWITQLASKINQAGGNAANKATTLILPIYFRTRKLAEYVIQDINQMSKENGTCPIYV